MLVNYKLSAARFFSFVVLFDQSPFRYLIEMDEQTNESRSRVARGKLTFDKMLREDCCGEDGVL